MLTSALRHAARASAAAGRAAARSAGRAERKMSGASVEEEVKEMNKWRVRPQRRAARARCPRAANLPARAPLALAAHPRLLPPRR